MHVGVLDRASTDLGTEREHPPEALRIRARRGHGHPDASLEIPCLLAKAGRERQLDPACAASLALLVRGEVRREPLKDESLPQGRGRAPQDAVDVKADALGEL